MWASEQRQGSTLEDVFTQCEVTPRGRQPVPAAEVSPGSFHWLCDEATCVQAHQTVCPWQGPKPAHHSSGSRQAAKSAYVCWRRPVQSAVTCLETCCRCWRELSARKSMSHVMTPDCTTYSASASSPCTAHCASTTWLPMAVWGGAVIAIANTVQQHAGCVGPGDLCCTAACSTHRAAKTCGKGGEQQAFLLQTAAGRERITTCQAFCSAAGSASTKQNV